MDTDSTRDYIDEEGGKTMNNEQAAKNFRARRSVVLSDLDDATKELVLRRLGLVDELPRDVSNDIRIELDNFEKKLKYPDEKLSGRQRLMLVVNYHRTVEATARRHRAFWEKELEHYDERVASDD